MQVKSKMGFHGWKEDELLPSGWMYRPSQNCAEGQQKRYDERYEILNMNHI